MPIKAVMGETPMVFMAPQGSPRPPPDKPQAVAWHREPAWPGMEEPHRQPVRGPMPGGFPKES